ncbi:MAG: glycosyltransferase family 4 protein [Chloroflexota bacterium]|nr:glycosyltransferase family 4 protein [Chloroflexota bacterium]
MPRKGNLLRILYIHNLNQTARTFGQNLARRGHTVTIYEPSLKGGSAPLPLKLAMLPGRILDMRRVIGSLNAGSSDIVHIHWASYGVLGLASRVPFVVHCHGSDVRYRLKQPFFHSALTFILRRAALVLCSTPDLLPVIRTVRPDAVFFPGPVDTERFAPCADNHAQARPWTILLFARLDLIKGCESAVQGIARFAARHPEVRVKLLDWGTETEKYRQRYGERFEFVPLVAPELVQHLICSADVVVGQVFLGALGLAELQAMSCARPVIASFRYEGAYPLPPPVCQAATAQDVDQHLEYLFQHSEAAAALGQRARRWVSDYHSHQDVARKLETLYESILSR